MVCRCFPASCLPRASCFCNLIFAITVGTFQLLLLTQCLVHPYPLCWSSHCVHLFQVFLLCPSLLLRSSFPFSFLPFFPVSTCCESDSVIIFFLDFYCFGLCLVICDIVSPIPAFRRQRQAVLILELYKFKVSMIYILNSRPLRTMQ